VGHFSCSLASPQELPVTPTTSDPAARSSSVADKLRAARDVFAGAAEEADRIGQLPDVSVAALRDSGLMRMLQPAESGGHEAHPCDFLEAVMAIRGCGAAAWVGGVVGVHPWQLAFMSRDVQQQVWGDDPDVWIASPYAPAGLATRVDGGYLLTGRWPFSSGTDHCDWVHIGGLIGDEQGQMVMPPQMGHFLLPRRDYTILDDSWDVVGLRGSGSKDLVVNGAFVPDDRVLPVSKLLDGTIAADTGRDEPLYRIPLYSLFASAIAASIIAICENALEAHLDHARERSNALGVPVKQDPHVLPFVGEAASEIRSCRSQLLCNLEELMAKVQAGDEITMEYRSLVRSDQVRCSWRAVQAVNAVFHRSGGAGLRMDKPLQRFWRDANAALTHAVNMPGLPYQTSALSLLGVAPAPGSIL
jgi:3-hydroxy-9,10-secoandrosta-1,3,5(10)-triene-9,17-dione monooxygenase